MRMSNKDGLDMYLLLRCDVLIQHGWRSKQLGRTERPRGNTKSRSVNGFHRAAVSVWLVLFQH